MPYLVRKQFSKTANHQKPKDDVEDEKKQKKSDGSTNHGQCLRLVWIWYTLRLTNKNGRLSFQVMTLHYCCLSSLFHPPRAPDLVTRRASPPAGPGAFLLERPPRRHERGIPRRKAPLLRPHYGWGPVLPGQHLSCLHWGKPTGESGQSRTNPDSNTCHMTFS